MYRYYYLWTACTNLNICNMHGYTPTLFLWNLIAYTPSVPNCRSFDFFDPKFDHSSYSKVWPHMSLAHVSPTCQWDNGGIYLTLRSFNGTDPNFPSFYLVSPYWNLILRTFFIFSCLCETQDKILLKWGSFVTQQNIFGFGLWVRTKK